LQEKEEVDEKQVVEVILRENHPLVLEQALDERQFSGMIPVPAPKSMCPTGIRQTRIGRFSIPTHVSPHHPQMNLDDDDIPYTQYQ